MLIGVLGRPDSWYVRKLRETCEGAGHRFLCLDYRRLTAGQRGGKVLLECAQSIDLRTLDALIVRTMPPGSLEQVVFRMDVLGRLERQGVFVINPARAIECAVDKYLTTSLLAQAGLPVPDTIVCESVEEACEGFSQLGGDVVVKPIFGSEGRGILRVSDPDLAVRAFSTLQRIQAVIYLQEFVPHEGFDIRLLVLGGEVVGAIKRCSPNDFRTNVSRSATAVPHEATVGERDLALRSADAVQSLFAGIDLLYDRRGRCYVLEVNAVPGWQAFQRVTGIDVAARLIQKIQQQRGA